MLVFFLISGKEQVRRHEIVAVDEGLSMATHPIGLNYTSQ
jgi:hypothetical protein